jgi:hypothetical protein
MANRSITLESSINFETREEYEKYRKRENIRAFVEEYRRVKVERPMSEVTVGTYNRIARQASPPSWWESLVCGDKNYGEEISEDSNFHP